MRINSNIASLKAQSALKQTSSQIARALERLSTGRRIDSAKDDSAGLSIATGLESQTRSLIRASQNINESYGIIQTADGALATQIELVQRMKELSTQSANGTLNFEDRRLLDQELQSLLVEFERIADQTEFNGVKLLDASFGSVNLQVGESRTSVIEFEIESSVSTDTFTKIRGDGTFLNSSTTTGQVGTTDTNATLADIDGDGNLDLISAGYNGANYLSINYGDGTGNFGTRVTYSTGGQWPIGIEAGDFNGDGRMDLVATNWNGASNSVGILLQNTSGGFATAVTTAVGSNPGGVESGDLDGDGDLDLIVTNSGNGTGTNASVLINNGQGLFTVGSTLTTGNGPAAPKIADFNGDGKLDLVIADQGASALSLYLGNGDGSFQGRTGVATASTPNELAIGDVDNDGDVDIISAHYFHAQNGVYLNNGSGSFSAGTALTTTNCQDQALVDLNDDGNLDLVTLQNAGTKIINYLGNGHGGFTAAQTLAGTYTYFDVGDLNGDGVVDIAGNTGTANLFAALGNADERNAMDLADISTQEQASNFLEVLDSALENLVSRRVALGALQSRLEYTNSNNQSMVESISAAKSNLYDADIAEETASLTRAQILQQAQISVLAQANQQLQVVLGLLKF